MGTWWSKGSEMGVVLTTLGLAVACGGKYDIGSGETGGVGGSGAADTGTGGSSTDPEGGGPATGGRGSSATGGMAGSGAGPSTGGVSTGGSGDACPASAGPLPEYVPAPPDVVWDRICRFLYGGTRAPFEPLPETTTVAWVRDRVDAALAEQYEEDERAPGGLEDFFRDWAFGGENESNAEYWAKNFAAPASNFSAFFAPMDGDSRRVSFLSDQSFLTQYQSSTRRGVWMAERLVCNGVLPPPEGI